MANAMRNARASFWEFARTIELDKWRIIPAFEATLIKAYFPNPSNTSQGEFLFVDEIVVTKSSVRGTLVSEPTRIRALSAGQEVAVPVENICDWFLVMSDKGIGGFTVDVLKKTIPDDQLDDYQSQPPVSWYRHRENTTAQNELDEIPVCKTCNMKDLLSMSYRDGQCGCCANALKRTNCPKCGVPLIRAENAPPVCHSCAQTSQSNFAKKPWWKFW